MVGLRVSCSVTYGERDTPLDYGPYLYLMYRIGSTTSLWSSVSSARHCVHTITDVGKRSLRAKGRQIVNDCAGTAWADFSDQSRSRPAGVL